MMNKHQLNARIDQLVNIANKETDRANAAEAKLNRLAEIMHGFPGDIDLLATTAMAMVARVECVKQQDELITSYQQTIAHLVPDEWPVAARDQLVSRFMSHWSDEQAHLAVKVWNSCRTAMLKGGAE